MSTPSPVATRTMSLKDLELHCEQLQVLLGQLRSEKEFVEKENTQLREAMQGEEARSAKISVWLDLERTRQAVRSPHARARHNMTCMRANTVTSHPSARLAGGPAQRVGRRQGRRRHCISGAQAQRR